MPVFRTGLNYRRAGELPRASVSQGFRFPSMAETIQTEGGHQRLPTLDIHGILDQHGDWPQARLPFGKEGQWKGFLGLAVFQQDFEDFVNTPSVWGSSGNGLDLVPQHQHGRPSPAWVDTRGRATSETTVQWLIGQTFLNPVSPRGLGHEPHQPEGISANTSSDTTDHVLKYAPQHLPCQPSLQHDRWTFGWNAARNTSIQNIDKAFLDIEELACSNMA